MGDLLEAVKEKLAPRRLATLSRPSSWRKVYRRMLIRYLDPERPQPFPRKVQIEATSKCNLRCTCCPHSREADKGQHLGPDELRELLRRLPRLPARAVLSGIGEPLVNPRFFELVDALSEQRIQCQFYTNGTLLTTRKCEEIISRPSIFKVEISCDGVCKETFEELRPGADFDRWTGAVREFVTKAREARKQRRRLRVGALTVLNKRTLGEIEGIIRLAADLGFDHITILDTIPIDDVAASLCASQAERSTICPEDLSALGRAVGIGVFFELRREQTPPKARLRCLQPWEYIFIRAGGDVAPCCALFGSDKAAVVGNLLQDDFADIWHGERFREFRRTSSLGTNPLCRACTLY